MIDHCRRISPSLPPLPSSTRATSLTYFALVLVERDKNLEERHTKARSRNLDFESGLRLSLRGYRSYAKVRYQRKSRITNFLPRNLSIMFICSICSCLSSQVVMWSEVGYLQSETFVHLKYPPSSIDVADHTHTSLDFHTNILYCGTGITAAATSNSFSFSLFAY